MNWYWVIYLAAGYLGIWIVPKISGARIGKLSGFLIPPSTMPIIFVVYCKFPWYVDALLIILQFILSIGTIKLYLYENKLDQENKDKLAEKNFYSLKKNEDSIPFALYLRPFDSTDMLLTQMTQTGSGPALHIDFETLLERALEPNLIFCCLGKPGEMLGAGRIETEENEWYSDFQLLANYTDLILMIPSNHDSTFKEMKYLTKCKLLHKCIFIMPETIDESLNYKSKWEDTRLVASKLGWELPYYDCVGGLFILKNDGTLDEFEYLSLSVHLLRVRRIRKIIRKFMRKEVEE